MVNNYQSDPRFQGLRPFPSKIWLSSPTMHGDELKFMTEAFTTNWMSTVGANINEAERLVAQKVGRKYAVALASGTAALHLAVKICGERLYGRPRVGQGTLAGQKVFCSDMTFDATVNPVAYENGEPVFIDTEYDTWNMDPEALDKAFQLYPDVKLVVLAHLYGAPAKLDELRDVCRRHNAMLVEDAAESFGASYKGVQTGAFGDVSVISMNGNKIVTGSSGGFLLTDELDVADKVRKWSTQSREAAPWYQHEELGYNYRMSNVIAGVIRGQLPYLEEHVAQKKAIYERYRAAFADLPVTLNSFASVSEPNYWLSCLLIDRDALAPHVRGEKDYLFHAERGKSSPSEILEALAAFNAEGRPIWKPMHMQPIYASHAFITRAGQGRGLTNAYVSRAESSLDVGADIFARGLCLPSDNKTTLAEIDQIAEIVRRCFSTQGGAA